MLGTRPTDDFIYPRWSPQNKPYDQNGLPLSWGASTRYRSSPSLNYKGLVSQRFLTPSISFRFRPINWEPDRCRPSAVPAWAVESGPRYQGATLGSAPSATSPERMRPRPALGRNPPTEAHPVRRYAGDTLALARCTTVRGGLRATSSRITGSRERFIRPVSGYLHNAPGLGPGCGLAQYGPRRPCRPAPGV